MVKWHLCGILAALGVSVVWAQDDRERPQLKTASGHPMQYYLSLPRGWTAGKEWPVVVVIEGANRQFRENAELFVGARREMPFIVVAPLVVTNGGPNYRHVLSYHYSDAAWDEVERVGGCRFDLDGVAAVVRDVQKLYGGGDKSFLTGWEAGGHPTWAVIFQRPEALRAAALSGPNYLGRCMDAARFSASPARVDLPVKVFQGADPSGTPNRFLQAQWEKAKQVAQEHGYRNVTRSLVPGKGHGPLAEEVLAYFSSLLKS